jgi:hypothetical protein
MTSKRLFLIETDGFFEHFPVSVYIIPIPTNTGSQGVVMRGKIDVLCGNYDEMTDEGKEELLTMGEKYLNEVDVSLNLSETEKTDVLMFKNEKLV